MGTLATICPQSDGGRLLALNSVIMDEPRQITMPVRNACLAISILASFSAVALAGIRPSFSGDSEAWRATDIAVVSTSLTDGAFVVDEVWKGDLLPGARVVVPELIPASDATSAAHYPDFWKDPGRAWNSNVAEQIPRQPVGSRMILFLKRKLSNSEELEWEPGNWMGSMKASVVWIEGDQLWSFIQVMNPGPSMLQPMSSTSVQQLKQRISIVLHTQRSIQLVLEVQDGAQRAQLLKPYLHSDVRDAGLLAMEELGKSGSTAVPTIREMLDDPAYANETPGLIKAMVEAGGTGVGADLNRRFKREVAFWESIGPTLAPGWWNTDPNPNAPLRQQYSQMYQLIVSLEQLRVKEALTPARELDELWISNPQLNDPSGLNQISLECERLIKAVQEN